MPYLHWEYSIACFHTMNIIEDARKVSEEAHPYKLQPTDIANLQCNVNEKLLRFHVPGKSWNHMRRTLDQSYYPTISDTRIRDQDQVVERYARKQQGDSWAEPHVLTRYG
jgi:hypothetical protein